MNKHEPIKLDHLGLLFDSSYRSLEIPTINQYDKKWLIAILYHFWIMFRITTDLQWGRFSMYFTLLKRIQHKITLNVITNLHFFSCDSQRSFLADWRTKKHTSLDWSDDSTIVMIREWKMWSCELQKIWMIWTCNY